jgi:hypothetical protein
MKAEAGPARSLSSGVGDVDSSDVGPTKLEDIQKRGIVDHMRKEEGANVGLAAEASSPEILNEL